ncbi:hypothetical protein [Fundicoccus ignavus]|uniref:Uncharacterized protein n=1 Tax=Fundicoccus ignavus TaxID=2664442 RepID=A0A844CEB9_9LACT|nr:hypothetical protein [Fundicoccus ignavus]MRJ46115.1 hypothetical protein [Fundicoccus ignavus]
MEKSKQTMELYVQSNQALDLAQKHQVQLLIGERKFTLQSDLVNKGNQVAALRQFLIPSLLVTAIFFFFLIRGQQMIALTGDFSISSTVTSLGVISGVLSFAYYFVH